MSLKNEKRIALVAEVLEDGIRNNDVSPTYKHRVLSILNPLELKTFMLSMAMHLETDDRIRVVKCSGVRKWN